MYQKAYTDEQKRIDAYYNQYKNLKYIRKLTPPENDFLSDHSDDNANFMLKKKPKIVKKPQELTISGHSKRYRNVGYFKNQQPDTFVLPHLRSPTVQPPDITPFSSQSSFMPNKTIRMGFVDKSILSDEQIRLREAAITKKLADSEESSKFRYSNATYLIGDIVSSIKKAKQRRVLPNSIEGILTQSRNVEANDHFKSVKGMADSYKRDWL